MLLEDGCFFAHTGLLEIDALLGIAHIYTHMYIAQLCAHVEADFIETLKALDII